ncbi:antitoxin Xre/MbcA/ParS toxin-binding domain-containing protein [Candidatus Omnitrophota bacterium]
MVKSISLNEILGLKNKIETPLDEIKAYELLTKKPLTKISALSGLSISEIISILPVSEKTIDRLKPNERISLVLAEHLMVLAKLVVEGHETFEDSKLFASWLKESHPLFKGLNPCEMMKTVTGCNIVETLLVRFKHGVYS